MPALIRCYLLKIVLQSIDTELILLSLLNKYFIWSCHASSWSYVYVLTAQIRCYLLKIAWYGIDTFITAKQVFYLKWPCVQLVLRWHFDCTNQMLSTEDSIAVNRYRIDTFITAKQVFYLKWPCVQLVLRWHVDCSQIRCYLLKITLFIELGVQGIQMCMISWW